MQSLLRAIRRASLMAFIAVLAPARSAAQADSTTVVDSTTVANRSLIAIFSDDVSIGLSDALGYVSAPAAFDSGDWLLAGAVAAGTAGLFAVDEPLRRWLLRQPYSYTLHKTSYYATFAGKAGAITAADAVLYGAALLLGADSLRIAARLMGEAMIFGGALTYLLQFTAGRERPYVNEGAFSYDPGQFNNTHQSLPSGHTMIAFACATVLAERSDNLFWKIAAYSIAGATGLSLLYRDLHWASDVFAGAAIGIITGQYVCARERARNGLPDTKAERLRIGASPGGVRVSYRF